MKKLQTIISAVILFTLVFSVGVNAQERSDRKENRLIEDSSEYDDELMFNTVDETESDEERTPNVRIQMLEEVPDETDESERVQFDFNSFTIPDTEERVDNEMTLEQFLNEENGEIAEEPEEGLPEFFDADPVLPIVLPDIPLFGDEDVELLAKLIWHEAEGEPRNGKIAVGEVVLNRFYSPLYPDSIYDVIYQPRQFSHVKYVKYETPDEETIQIAYDVLNRELKVLNNSAVLYFRNPYKTSGISADTRRNWGRHQYFTYFGNHAFYIHRSGGRYTADPVVYVEPETEVEEADYDDTEIMSDELITEETEDEEIPILVEVLPDILVEDASELEYVTPEGLGITSEETVRPVEPQE